MKLFSLIFLFLSIPAFGYFGFNEAERCRIDSDPYAVPAWVPGMFGEGRLGPVPNALPIDTGKCVQQDQYRPALTLAKNPERRWVANVRHIDGKWYTASIPVTAVTKIYFLVHTREIVFLGKRGGHSETRVFFNEPVNLIPQWPYDPSQFIQAYDLIFSSNPTGSEPHDRENTPIKTFDGSMLLARGIGTRESRLWQSFIDNWTWTSRQYELKMSPTEIADYINYYLDRADQTRLTQHFYLQGRNCDRSQFEIFDYVLRGRYSFPFRPFDPEFAAYQLKRRGLIDDSSEVQALESEPWAKEVFEKYGKHVSPR